MNILIKSSARTGSHMLYDMFCAMGYKGYHTSWFYRDIDCMNRPRLAHKKGYLESGQHNIVVHDHTNWVPDNPEEWWLIYSQRCDIIAQSLSEELAAHIKEYHPDDGALGYSETEYKPFTVPIFSLLGKCKHRQQWNYNLDRVFTEHNWLHRDVLVYESLVNKTPRDVIKFLGMSTLHRLPDDYTWDSQKSPRSTREMILNYDEAYEFCRRNM
tara:strand:+ start:750 stop:1388 length:639 start_codon:yes stop_codon:yes gene_type:complete